MTSHAARRPYLSLAPFGAAVAVAALAGGLGVAGTASEYQSLRQPPWAPPSWLFGPVWTLLYVLIAVAGWLVWRRVGWTPALTAYAVQLVLNAIWTPIFFGFGQYGLALADIIVMWLMIGVTVFLFRPVSRLAAGLLLPYWAWVTFATALNAWIWHAN
ncbi:tryptophan-rich sensory protein [Winogradskya consettensis]|uniref:TspO/MBR-related protein n=1 Tax=Winogradskya consettensis TaxID=113560 RepID=A0A919VUI7_9ACTN|nr:TspO/MBR family protein [Actinoplanes consettensis]GIM79449.1 putative TspO/MBR-related protein precursor [Actinoplanes consettensis]